MSVFIHIMAFIAFMLVGYTLGKVYTTSQPLIAEAVQSLYLHPHRWNLTYILLLEFGLSLMAALIFAFGLVELGPGTVYIPEDNSFRAKIRFISQGTTCVLLFMVWVAYFITAGLCFVWIISSISLYTPVRRIKLSAVKAYQWTTFSQI